MSVSDDEEGDDGWDGEVRTPADGEELKEVATVLAIVIEHLDGREESIKFDDAPPLLAYSGGMLIPVEVED